MKVKYLGHSSFLITADNGTNVVTDPYEAGGYGGAVGYGPITEVADVATVSHDHADHGYVQGLPGKPVVLNTAGAQEVKGINFRGVSAFHDANRSGERGSNVIFVFKIDGLNVCHVGDLGHTLNEVEAQAIGPVDLLLLPVGGLYTVDAAAATQVAQTLKPRVIIPMHYKTEKCGFPLATVDGFLEGKNNVQQTKNSEIEISKESLPEATKIAVLQPAL